MVPLSQSMTPGATIIDTQLVSLEEQVPFSIALEIYTVGVCSLPQFYSGTDS